MRSRCSFVQRSSSTSLDNAGAGQESQCWQDKVQRLHSETVVVDPDRSEAEYDGREKEDILGIISCWNVHVVYGFLTENVEQMVIDAMTKRCHQGPHHIRLWLDHSSLD